MNRTNFAQDSPSTHSDRYFKALLALLTDFIYSAFTQTCVLKIGYDLFQNYPNPFSAITIFAFTLPIPKRF